MQEEPDIRISPQIQALCSVRLRWRQRASILAKAIDGVYDSDPKINPSAVKYSEVSIQEVIDRKLAVVDLTASIMCMENKMPMFVFGLNEENSIVKAMTGRF